MIERMVLTSLEVLCDKMAPLFASAAATIDSSDSNDLSATFLYEHDSQDTTDYDYGWWHYFGRTGSHVS
jgi:hypothetical protein